MREVESLLSVLVSEDPKRSAERILSKLLAVHRGRGGAVLAVDQGIATVFASQDLDLGRLTRLGHAWRSHLKALEEGRSVVQRSFCLNPVLAQGQLVAVVYLEGVEDLGSGVATVFGTALAQAVRAAQHPPLDAEDLLTSVSSADVMKRQLFLALERNEWNIARVARLLGVTRRTIYMRLRSYGIERKRVPKTFKPMPGSA